MFKRRLSIAIAVILLLALCGCAAPTAGEAEKVEKYTLYIGLNDKDTYQQKFSIEEAEELVTEIILKHADGFTRFVGKGAYKDNQGVVTYENSLIYEFLYVTEEQITQIMDEVLIALNQNSILVEKQTVACEFYEGVRP